MPRKFRNEPPPQRLTPAQSKMVEENLGLCHFMARRFTKDADTIDQLVSDFNVVLMRCSRAFNPERGTKFSTYACNSMARHYFRFCWNQTRSKTVSLNKVRNDPPDTSTKPIDCDSKDIYREAMASLTDQERALVVFKTEEGMTLRQMGAVFGLSKERIRQIESKLVLKLREKFGSDAKDLPKLPRATRMEKRFLAA